MRIYKRKQPAQCSTQTVQAAYEVQGLATKADPVEGGE